MANVVAIPQAGLNELIRRSLFPERPRGEPIGGFIFFPWRDGPFVPIPADDSPFLPIGIASPQFTRKPAAAFINVAVELGDIPRARMTREVAKAAGLTPAEVDKLTTGKLARTIAERALTKIHSVGSNVMETATVANYLNALAVSSKAANLQFDPKAAAADLAKQTGLAPKDLAALPVGELGDYLDVIGDPTAPPVVRMTTGTICVTSGGQTRCGNGPPMFEDAIWGICIGGVIGGEIGAIIGAIIGVIIGWLFGDD